MFSALSILSNLLFNVLSVALYPLKVTIAFFRKYNKRSTSANAAYFIFVMFVYVVYIGVLIACNSFFSTDKVVELGGVFTTIYGNKLVEYVGPSEFPSYGSGGTTGGGSFDGNDYIIDLDEIPDNITLPSNYYQLGSVRARAELLLLVQEICARPELDITPAELLGIFYVERNGLPRVDNSIILETEDEELDAYGSSGPTQHIVSAFYESSMSEVKGRTFISKLENANIPDSERVLTVEESEGLTTPDGKPRPNPNYFPDALYSTANRISAYKQGIYNGRTDQATKPIMDYLTSVDLGDELENTLRYGQACSRYNSYNKLCCLTWVPQLYIDIYNQHGPIDGWSDLATSNVGLLRAFSGSKVNGIPYDEGGGLVMSTIKTSIPPVPDKYNCSTYNEYWTETLEHNYHSPHNYLFWALNGGTWIYEGLSALGESVGSVVDNGGVSSNGTVNELPVFKGGLIDGEWVRPLDDHDYIATALYNEPRTGYNHTGLDIGVPKGDNLYAIQDGVVVLARWDSGSDQSKPDGQQGGGGRMVFILHDNGIMTRYMHMSAFEVSVGDTVKMGQVIGKVGNTGGSTGSHLHFEIRENATQSNWGDTMDPYFIFAERVIEIRGPNGERYYLGKDFTKDRPIVAPNYP